ncbi:MULTISPECIES: G5 domain-containing protein [unclassified Streptococcus]|uniref:G5 domain-containing protein n=1 Tax=unclassified Streptococcus TaxID=2608887 RepID=UPI00211B4170|nr:MULTISPECIES: G5 domain-containing protein [unclassified Streptococcus]MCQ9211808.1 G5 domain-containing protein [Streptococcus sp. B01]MCQ9212839.1 G5 domain-containing protein [Streptococcus sp. B01]MCQ9212928.1 G5 domain-containing protein [Streptococcus sp. O1]MCQ9215004.1 G5 domain-containing protein [Streptococcus sp. O1]
MRKQKPTKNSTSLIQIEGGQIIKQNDYSSNFIYELQDEFKQKIPTLEGKEAKIVLVKKLETEELKVAFEAIVRVSAGRVEFTIIDTLEPDTYFVEVYCEGYIFPSKNKVTIEVTKSSFGKVQLEDNPNDEITIDFSEEIIEDDSLFVGDEVVEQEGEEGVKRRTWNGDELISEEIVKEPVNRVVRKGTKLREYTAYATIARGANLAAADFFESGLGDGMSKELADGKQLITSSSLQGAVAYSTLHDVQAGSYEILIKARKTSDEATAIRFGFENLGQMQEFSDISSETTEYSFVATVDKLYSALYYHFRTNGSVELESVQIRKVTISDLSWEDTGQSHIGVAQSAEKEIPLEFNRFKWKEKE